MIYNGPSIYKFGGGGGGYKDGGQLVDGDFIKVENNTISSYDNLSRDPVNFYLEPADGEILNAVVELTTAVNSTINVYVLKNGFYYILGIVGANSVVAGQDYTVNIIGDSYVVENVTPQSTEPSAVKIAGRIYGIKKIGSLYWTTSNLKDDYSHYEWNGEFYYNNHLPIDGWHIPTTSECDDLIAAYPNTVDVKSTTNWVGGGGNGNNSSELNFHPTGYWNSFTNRPDNIGNTSVILRNKNGTINTFTIRDIYVKSGFDPAPIRLVHDV